MAENDGPTCCSVRRPSSCWIGWGLAFMAVIGVLSFRDYFGAKLGYAPPADHAVGRVAPAFEATTIDGKAVRFPDDYRGKLVLVDFWATWCMPCVGEIPHIKAAYEKFGAQGLVVLSVSLDKSSSVSLNDFRSFVERQQMAWPQVYDGADAVADRYGVRAIPAMFLVDGDTGRIVAAGEQLHGHYLAATISDALAQRNAPSAASQPMQN